MYIHINRSNSVSGKPHLNISNFKSESVYLAFTVYKDSYQIHLAVNK